MSGYMGGVRITSLAWVSPTAIQALFSSTYDDTKYYQLYAGRSRIGLSIGALDRALVGQLEPSHYPQEISLLAVDPADRNTDFGALLPPRPYNRVKLDFSVGAWTDGKFISISSGYIPGGACDPANELIRLLFSSSGPYEYITPPLSGTGTWNLQAAGVDDALPNGNEGTPLAFAPTILAHPPDVLADAQPRLTAAVSAGVVNIGFAYNW